MIRYLEKYFYFYLEDGDDLFFETFVITYNSRQCHNPKHITIFVAIQSSYLNELGTRQTSVAIKSLYLNDLGKY